jgi:hypothetical protein
VVGPDGSALPAAAAQRVAAAVGRALGAAPDNLA